MNEQMNETRQTPPRRSFGCLRVTGISCLVVFLIGLVGWIWLYNMVMKVPRFRDYRICVEHVVQIGGALQRYSQRNGHFPDSLAQLYPDFLDRRVLLHCPADKRPVDVISYDYKRPDAKAPATTVVLTCRRHVLMDRQPPVVISLQKDGQLVKPSLNQFQDAK